MSDLGESIDQELVNVTLQTLQTLLSPDTALMQQGQQHLKVLQVRKGKKNLTLSKKYYSNNINLFYIWKNMFLFWSTFYWTARVNLQFVS